MLDLTRLREHKIAPRAVFDALPALGTRPRFMVDEKGDFRSVTWNAFAAQIKEIALFLASSGLERGDRAAIFAPNRVEWMSAALGIQAAGGVMVPIYPASTSAQAGYVANHSDAKFVFIDTRALLSRVLENLSDYSAVLRFVLFDDTLDIAPVLEELRAKGKDVPDAAAVEARFVHWSRAIQMGKAKDQATPAAFEERMASISMEDIGIMLYTSGTTGHPKGVPLTHTNVAVNGGDWFEVNATLLDDQGMIDLLWLPMSHVFGFGEVCLGNALGFTTYLTDATRVLDLLPKVHPDVFMSVPAYWEKISQRVLEAPSKEEQRQRFKEVTGGKLRFCLSGGAGLKKQVKELFYECGVLIIEGYGLTECSPTLTMNRPDSFRFDSVGKAFPSVELKLAEDGEILAKAKSIFRGYHKEPAATKEVFTEDGWFKTGDVGRWTDDGFLQIIDRKKEILVTAGGKNVPPQNIELRFRDEKTIEHVVVYGDNKKYLVAGVWVSPETMDAELVRRGATSDTRAKLTAEIVGKAVAKVNEELASFEQVKKFVIMPTPLTVASGLLTSTLKVRRKKVYEAFQKEFEGLYEGQS